MQMERKKRCKLKLFWTFLQKKPKIMGKDHCMSEISKHSTSTEAMFFEKVRLGVLRVAAVHMHVCVFACGTD